MRDMAVIAPWRRLLVVWLGLLILGGATGCKSTSKPSTLSLTDLSGKAVPISQLAGSRGCVLVYVAVDCPIANRAVPELLSLACEFKAVGMPVYFVHASAFESVAEIRQHSEEYGIEVPVLRDVGQRVARQYEAHVTPEAVALTGEGRLIYRGRINDQHSALGQDRPQPTKHDLAEAVRDYLTRGVVTGRVVPAVGCTFRSL